MSLKRYFVDSSANDMDTKSTRRSPIRAGDRPGMLLRGLSKIIKPLDSRKR